MSDPSREPSFLKALALVALYLGFQSGVAMLMMIPAMVIHHELRMNTATIAVANTLAMVPTVVLGAILCGIPWRRLLVFGPLRLQLAPAVIVMGAGSFVLCSEVENLTRYLLPMPKVVSQFFRQLFDVADNPWSAGVALVVVAPLTEELLCRSWVLGSLLRKWRPWRAIALSAFVFGLMHMNPWQFFYAALLGVSFGWIYWRTRSLWLCALAHGLNNGLAWFLSYFRPEIPGMSGAHSDEVMFQAWWLDASALALFIFGVSWLWQGTRHMVFELPAEVLPASPPPLPPAA